MKIFEANKNLQFSSPREIKEFQDRALVANIEYMATASPYYKELFSREKIDAAKIPIWRASRPRTKQSCKNAIVILWLSLRKTS